MDQIYAELQACLKPKRYHHSVSVAYTAASIAMSYGRKDTDRFLLAGLLHDCAKYMTDEEFVLFCREHKLPVSEVEEKCGFLLHAKVGAYFAEHKYGVTDQEILSAIVYHTTGKPDMTFLEQCIFCADYIEPLREIKSNPATKDPEYLTKIRKKAYRDIDAATFDILDATMKYLTGTQRTIDQTTVQTHVYYKEILQKKSKQNGN